MILCVSISKIVLAQPTVPAAGRLAYHSYTSYGALDGEIHLYDFADDTVSSVGMINQYVQHAINPNYSTDGTRIVFMGIPRGPNYGSNWPNFLDVYEYDFTKGKLTNLSAAAELGSSIDEDAVFGPNNATVIYKKNRDDLWSIDLTTYQSTQLFPSGVEVSGPKVSASGQGITYWTGAGATANVYRREFQPNGSVGSAIAVSTTPSLQEYFPSFLDDQTIVYTRWSSLGALDDDIYITDLGTGLSTGAAFNQSGGADDSDAFRLQDNNTVGFSSTRSGGKGGYDLYIGDATAGDVHYLQVASTSKEDLGASYTPQIASVLSGQTLFEETFDTNATGTTAFHDLYGGPQLGATLDNTSISVSGGQLRLATSSGFGDANVATTSWYAPDAGIVIRADIGADASGGEFNVGITLGDTPIVFHPGYAVTPGAFRIGSGSNQDMGFIPANGILHPWEIAILESGEVTITITDGANSANVFTTSYTDVALADGFSVGLRREGGAGSAPHYGLYDNLQIATAPVDRLGDFNNDGSYDCLDINALVGEIVRGTNNTGFDLTGDGSVDGDDLAAWLVEGGANNPNQTGGNPFLEGDANLDGTVDGQDFIEWNNNKFTSLAEWCGGDFNADGFVDGHDFITWNSNKFTSSDAVIAVPEPSAALLAVFGGIVLYLRIAVIRENSLTTGVATLGWLAILVRQNLPTALMFYVFLVA